MHKKRFSGTAAESLISFLQNSISKELKWNEMKRDWNKTKKKRIFHQIFINKFIWFELNDIENKEQVATILFTVVVCFVFFLLLLFLFPFIWRWMEGKGGRSKQRGYSLICLPVSFYDVYSCFKFIHGIRIFTWTDHKSNDKHVYFCLHEQWKISDFFLKIWQVDDWNWGKEVNLITIKVNI